MALIASYWEKLEITSCGAAGMHTALGTVLVTPNSSQPIKILLSYERQKVWSMFDFQLGFHEKLAWG